MTANQVKLLVSVFCLLALWRIFELPGVATAFWEFCTVGAIPGTPKVLGFETLARLLILVFVVVLLIVFRREFMAARPKLVRHRPDTTTHQAIAGTLAVTEAVQPVQPLHQSRKDAVVVVLSRQIDRPNFSIIRPLLALLLMTVVGLMRSVSWVERLLHRTGSQLFAASKRCTTLGYQLGKRVWRQLYRTTVRGTVVIVRILVTLWKLGEPHFRAFDRYLDELLHANKYSAEALKAISGTSKTVSDAYQKAHKTTRKLLETK